MADQEYVDLLPEEVREVYLNAILSVYVDRQGLGGVSKPDFDALLVYLHVTHVLKSRFDAHLLSEIFHIRESRAKSLYETGLIKYGRMTEGQAWLQILHALGTVTYEVQLYESGDIRFRFNAPALYRYFDAALREAGKNADYDPDNEVVRMNIYSFFALLEHVASVSSRRFRPVEADQVVPLCGTVVSRIERSFGKKTMNDLRAGKLSDTLVAAAIKDAAGFAHVGNLVEALMQPKAGA